MARRSNRHFVITLGDRIVNKAEQSCLRRGTTLRHIIENVIVEQAKVKTTDDDAFIKETDVMKLDWCPTRSTLFNMRQSGELRRDESPDKDDPNAHYVVNDKLIFYRLKRLRDFMRRHYPHIKTNNIRRNEAITG